MEPQRYQEIKDLLFEASRRTGMAREAFLRQIDDAGLRREVERLLQAQSVATSDVAPALETALPSPPFEVADYRTESELGRGGMAVVYHARHKESGEEVALKVVHGTLRQPLRERLLREARAGARVRHRNVVQTLGAGMTTLDDKEIAYLVLEFVEGETLRALLDRLGTVPEALLREIARQVAAGLDAIHTAGIVHRDVKPENVLITDDERVRLMDLGIARVDNATAELTQSGQFVGSLHYAAPEQFEGGDVGPAADLYALGVVLYELATGENPFRQDTPGAAFRAHLDLEAPPAHERNPEITTFFSEVIATLLAKQPPGRFASAAALRDALSEAEYSAWWREHAPVVRRRQFPPVRVRRETRLFGRDREVAQLEQLWMNAREGTGAAVLVEGEAGLGKTRLVDALLHALDDEVHVLYGSFPPAGGMGGLTDAIRGTFGAAQLKERLAPYLEAAPRLADALAAFVLGEQAEPLPADALVAVCGHLGRALAAERPTLWVLDDLHFAPQEARAAALALARIAAPHALLVVLTARPGMLTDELASLARLEHFRRITLRRLSPREVVEVLRDAFLSDRLADRLGARIAYKSDGVPFFIFEVIRGLKEGQFIKQQPDGSYVQTRDIEAIEVPSAIRDLIGVRLRDLDKDERALLDVGSVLGYEFDADQIAAVTERPVVRVLQDLANIERKHGVVRAAGRLFRFDHHQIQEVVYAELPPALRDEYHSLLAERGGGEAWFVAHHHLHGSRPAEGLPHLEEALEHLERRALHEDAITLLSRAAPLLEGTERALALVRKATCLEILGRRDEQREAADEALAAAEAAGDPVALSRAHRSLANWSWLTRRPEETLHHFRQAFEHACASDDDELEAMATSDLGIGLVNIDEKEAIERYTRAIELAREIGATRVEAKSLANLAILHHSRGRYAESLSFSDRAGVLYEQLDDRRAHAYWAGWAASIRYAGGKLAEARRFIGQKLDTCRELGDLRGEQGALGTRGLIALEEGDGAAAFEDFRAQLEISREIDDLTGVSLATVNLGNLLMGVGRFEEAQEYFDRALELAKIAEQRLVKEHTEFLLGYLALNRGDHQEAERFARLALDGLAVDPQAHTQGLVHRLLGRVLKEQGRRDEAFEHLDRAIEIAREKDTPGLLVISTLLRERHDEALELLEKYGARAGFSEEMETHFEVWKATGKREHLEEARKRLEHIREHLPEGTTAEHLQRVPLYREIVDARP